MTDDADETDEYGFLIRDNPPDPCYPLSIHRLLLGKRSVSFGEKIGMF
jgi:hypothetical protein